MSLANIYVAALSAGLAICGTYIAFLHAVVIPELRSDAKRWHAGFRSADTERRRLLDDLHEANRKIERMCARPRASNGHFLKKSERAAS